jgi:hypothetical protein
VPSELFILHGNFRILNVNFTGNFSSNVTLSPLRGIWKPGTVNSKSL